MGKTYNIEQNSVKTLKLEFLQKFYTKQIPAIKKEIHKY